MLTPIKWVFLRQIKYFKLIKSSRFCFFLHLDLSKYRVLFYLGNTFESQYNLSPLFTRFYLFKILMMIIWQMLLYCPQCYCQNRFEKRTNRFGVCCCRFSFELNEICSNQAVILWKDNKQKQNEWVQCCVIEVFRMHLRKLLTQCGWKARKK